MISLMTWYTLNSPFIRIAMCSITMLLADGKVLSNVIIYDLVYIQLTFHTHSDVKQKIIGS